MVSDYLKTETVISNHVIEGVKKQEELSDIMRIQLDHLPYESLLLNLEKGFTGCNGGLDVCKILFEGDVHACPFLPVSVGNVHEQSFPEIWKTSPSPVLEKLRTNQYLKGECAACDYKIVRGGCRASACAYIAISKKQTPPAL